MLTTAHCVHSVYLVLKKKICFSKLSLLSLTIVNEDYFQMDIMFFKTWSFQVCQWITKDLLNDVNRVFTCIKFPSCKNARQNFNNVTRHRKISWLRAWCPHTWKQFLLSPILFFFFLPIFLCLFWEWAIMYFLRGTNLYLQLVKGPSLISTPC